MKTEFDIRPYEGAGDLRFGMKPEQVSFFIGAPSHTDTSDPEEIRESRRDNGLQTVYSPVDRRLVEVGFSPNIVELTFHDLSVFIERPLKVFQKFLEDDKEPYQTLGFIILLNIGVTLTGFHDNSPDDRAVTIFEKGRWDSVKSRMKPYKFR